MAGVGDPVYVAVENSPEQQDSITKFREIWNIISGANTVFMNIEKTDSYTVATNLMDGKRIITHSKLINPYTPLDNLTQRETVSLRYMPPGSKEIRLDYVFILRQSQTREIKLTGLMAGQTSPLPRSEVNRILGNLCSRMQQKLEAQIRLNSRSSTDEDEA